MQHAHAYARPHALVWSEHERERGTQHAHAHAYILPLQVDAERDLPSGELVIGLNPPFGHQNRIAIDFVEHALCAIAAS
eukprot:scaffold41290_cov71-Phaeocystis_antarctica.AAC.1